jgi:diaminohydroxyphosphoribosylaminopyrimidine deaminase/5-amino-6-(5-phosphoribosylamino)uracil reductase
MLAPQAEDDLRYMARALELARRGEGFVEPNPMVGCVLVHERAIVGEGWHRRFGGPHAEVEAVTAAGAAARGATAYVTLEPCAHAGKTPPCTQALIRAGVSRVVGASRA